LSLLKDFRRIISHRRNTYEGFKKKKKRRKGTSSRSQEMSGAEKEGWRGKKAEFHAD